MKTAETRRTDENENRTQERERMRMALKLEGERKVDYPPKEQRGTMLWVLFLSSEP